MDEKIIYRLCLDCFGEVPQSIKRCTVGQANYVYIVDFEEIKYVFRFTLESGGYKNTIYLLERLAEINVPVPKVITQGKAGQFEYLILSYCEGKDIGLIYPQLKDADKRTIAKEIVDIQNKVATLKLDDVNGGWSWNAFINYILDRAKSRIAENGYFDVEKVERLCKQRDCLEAYFASVKPIPYLDDISSKNLLIENGHISGVIDVDWIGIGDKLTFAALTNMALMNMDFDTDYVKYILEELQLKTIEKEAFVFYTLMYCVDFMGERGMQFMDKKVQVNEQIISRLNKIYDGLWKEWNERVNV